YMGDFGTSCTWALNKLVEITPELKAAGVQVYAISVKPMAMHRRFDARMNFPFALISDEGGAVTKEYGVLIEKHPIYQGMAGRAVYLIGKEGKILYSWVSEDDPAGSPDFQVLLRTVKGLV
ncbi:MAG: redoxin domain-containing protein, partial [Candidatus Methanomethylophilaceae archaeon]